jgi:FKBP-type peptidyl-prolyl cis-trans isomerase FklB
VIYGDSVTRASHKAANIRGRKSTLCENGRMRKITVVIAMGFIAVALGAGWALAQQNQSGAPAQTPGAPAAKKPAAASQPASAALATTKQKTSYALGMNIGKGLSKEPMDLDTASLVQGLKDALGGGKTQLTDDEMGALLTQLQNDVRQKQAAAQQAEGEKNVKEGADFLAANKTKDGVVTLPSGLQYKIITAGTGPKPAAGDTVICQYRGTFIDGKEFDSSYKRGMPATFPVGGVIKGWTEALQLMPVGSKWQLFVPPDLAYGGRGAGNVIGPNATLVFEVELVSIKGK